MLSAKDNLKSLVQGIYDLQKLRIQTGNRIVANYKIKLGQDPSNKEDTIDKEAAQYLESVRQHFRLLTEGLLTIPTPSSFKPDGVIDNYTEMNLIAMYTRVYEDELLQFKRIKGTIKDFPIWTEFLIDIKGVGPMMAAVIISSLDPHKAKYPSSFHKYLGLDVVNGEGRSKKKRHLIDVDYIDAEGDPQTKKSITYNPWAKTKLVGVLGPCFVKQDAAVSKYRRIYNDYKHRISHHIDHKDKSKGHRNNMAIRYMVKQFLIDLHMKWRELEGLPVSLPYAEAKLGYTHGKDQNAA